MKMNYFIYFTLFIKDVKTLFSYNELHPQVIHVDQKTVNRELCAN